MTNTNIIDSDNSIINSYYKFYIQSFSISISISIINANIIVRYILSILGFKVLRLL